MFTETYKQTVGVDYAMKIVNIDASSAVRLQIWDIAGQ